mgnify:CR=1 FL=1
MEFKGILYGIYFVVLPIVVIAVFVFGLVYGILYWTEVSGPERFLSKKLDGVTIFYPEMIRPDSTYTVEIEVESSGPLTESLIFEENDDFIVISPPTILPEELKERTEVDLETRNLRTAPRQAQVIVKVGEESATLVMKVDNWTRRVIATISGILGLVGTAAGVVNFVKSFRSR